MTAEAADIYGEEACAHVKKARYHVREREAHVGTGGSFIQEVFLLRKNVCESFFGPNRSRNDCSVVHVSCTRTVCWTERPRSMVRSSKIHTQPEGCATKSEKNPLPGRELAWNFARGSLAEKQSTLRQPPAGLVVEARLGVADEGECADEPSCIFFIVGTRVITSIGLPGRASSHLSVLVPLSPPCINAQVGHYSPTSLGALARRSHPQQQQRRSSFGGRRSAVYPRPCADA